MSEAYNYFIIFHPPGQTIVNGVSRNNRDIANDFLDRCAVSKPPAFVARRILRNEMGPEWDLELVNPTTEKESPE